jgi:hypothetical protein
MHNNKSNRNKQEPTVAGMIMQLPKVGYVQHDGKIVQYEFVIVEDAEKTVEKTAEKKTRRKRKVVTGKNEYDIFISILIDRLKIIFCNNTFKNMSTKVLFKIKAFGVYLVETSDIYLGYRK